MILNKKEFLIDVGMVVSKIQDLLQQLKSLNKISKDMSQRIEESIVRTLATIGIINEHEKVGIDTGEAEDILRDIHESNKKIHKALIDMKRFFC